MRILRADRLPESALTRLRTGGDELVLEPALTTADLPDALAGVEVLVVRSTRVDAAAIDAADALGLIVRAGAGTNTIDCERAAERAIFVCNVPGRNALAVAELTMGLLLAVDRHIATATADLREGRWDKTGHAAAGGLFGRRLGIVGLGDIGLAVAERATAFGMEVVAVAKPGRSPARVEAADDAGVEFVTELDELLRTSDVVSVHVPAGPETRGMVDAGFLASMRDDAILLNTSRGDVVDEAALLAALDERGLRAGLDVFADEPSSGRAEFDSPLARHPNVVGTHHIGASTRQAQEAVGAGAVDVIDAYRRGEILDCVNLEIAPPRAATITVRHHDQVGVLASVLQVLRGANLNVQTMRNRVFAGSVAAVATIDVGSAPGPEVLAEIRELPHIIATSVITESTVTG